MKNTRRTQIAADGLVAAAVLALGVVLVVAGRTLARELAPGATGDWLRIAPRVADGGGAPDMDVLLGLVASLVGMVVVAWWLLSMALAIVAALLAAAGAPTASRWTGTFAPAFMRRLALAVLGLSLVAVPAHADALPDPAWHPTASRGVSAGAEVQGATAAGTDQSAGLPPAPTVPEAAWVPAAPSADPGILVAQPLRPTGAPSTVEVRPGDSLWAIVARHLGPAATDLDIATAWPSWYRANAGTIGESPDLIQPGQLLVPPG